MLCNDCVRGCVIRNVSLAGCVVIPAGVCLRDGHVVTALLFGSFNTLNCAEREETYFGRTCNEAFVYIYIYKIYLHKSEESK